MKGLSWSAYSKEKPNIVVAGPVPGQTYPNLVLPILAPDPAKLKRLGFFMIIYLMCVSTIDYSRLARSAFLT